MIDWDVNPQPETHFIGYKCPYYYCDIITEAHDSCLLYRRRYTSIGYTYEATDDEFMNMFQFNWNQFLLKTQSRIMENWEER